MNVEEVAYHLAHHIGSMNIEQISTLIKNYASDQIKKDRAKVVSDCTEYKEWTCDCAASGCGYIEANRGKVGKLTIDLD